MSLSLSQGFHQGWPYQHNNCHELRRVLDFNLPLNYQVSLSVPHMLAEDMKLLGQKQRSTATATAIISAFTLNP